MGDFPFLVDDAIPEDEEIAWKERRLCLNCSGGPLEMREEHLCQWLIVATWDDSPDDNNLQKVVNIVQAAFHDGTLDRECMWRTFFLIPKVNIEFRGIGRIYVLWKALASLLN